MPSVSPDDVGDALSKSLYDQAIEHDISRVYLAVLQHERPTRELLLAQGLPAATVDAALGALAARGLISYDAARSHFEVLSPQTVLPNHAAELERRAQVIRATAHELAQLYYNARTRGHDPDVEVKVLHDLDEVAAATEQVLSEAREGVFSMRAMTRRTADLVQASLARHREPSFGADGRALAPSTLWDSRVLELPQALDVLQARAEGGERQRFLGRVPVSVVLVDDSACLLEWSFHGATGPQGMILRTRAMVVAIHRVVGRLWELGTPVTRGALPDELDARDRTILKLMAGGVADAAIARQVGVSQRTVERRIRAVLGRLGAQTRFQAGVQAAHRGWL